MASTQQRFRIAGAGPSGLAAAIVLARGGRRVEVLEARPRVGDRFIGDFQVLENSSESEDARELLDGAGIAVNFDFEPAREAVLFNHRLRPFEVRSERPYGYFLRRGPMAGTLDSGLLTQARELGVEVRFGRRARPGEVDIAATGPAFCDGLARELTFTTPLADRTWVLFDQERAPGGYSYLFVRRGFATFGTAIVRDFRRIDDYFVACLARFRELEEFTPEEPRTGYSYMNFTLKPTAAANGTLFAGEAGGFQDYLFGLGIRYALTSGAMAGQALLEGIAYDRLWRARLGSKQRTSLVNRFLYEAGGNAGLGVFARQAARSDFDRYLADWHRPALWKRALLPLVRALWRRRSGDCRHRLVPHWCRKASAGRAAPVPELGELEPQRVGNQRGSGTEP